MICIARSSSAPTTMRSGRMKSSTAAPSPLERRGSVEGVFARLDDADLRRVQIQAEHVVPDFGETGAAHEADVARADDGDLQIWSPGIMASARIPRCASAGRFPSRR